MAIPPAQPRRSLSRWRFTAVVLLAVCMWFGEREWTTPRVDSGSAWRIEFGRGSGMHGLDTAAVGSDGTVVLHRLDRRGEGCWETTTLTLLCHFTGVFLFNGL